MAESEEPRSLRKVEPRVDLTHSVRQIDGIFADRLFLLEQRMQELEHKTEGEMKEMSSELRGVAMDLGKMNHEVTMAMYDLNQTVQALSKDHKQFEPTLESIKNFFAASSFLKRLVVAVAGLFTAIGTIIGATELLSAFFK